MFNNFLKYFFGHVTSGEQPNDVTDKTDENDLICDRLDELMDIIDRDANVGKCNANAIYEFSALRAKLQINRFK